MKNLTLLIMCLFLFACGGGGESTTVKDSQINPASLLLFKPYTINIFSNTGMRTTTWSIDTKENEPIVLAEIYQKVLNKEIPNGFSKNSQGIAFYAFDDKGVLVQQAPALNWNEGF